MGEVYRARDSKLQRDVALKILPELFALDADRLARFQREAQVLASLNHPNIAAIYGFEEQTDVVSGRHAAALMETRALSGACAGQATSSLLVPLTPSLRRTNRLSRPTDNSSLNPPTNAMTFSQSAFSSAPGWPSNSLAPAKARK